MQSDLLKSVFSTTLDNGLKVICLPKHDAPIVSIQVWYKTGSLNETDSIRGISHILEHMMFRGSAHVESEQHARAINDVGGHCNAFTSEDVTVYTNSVPVDHLELVLGMEADRMNQLTIDPGILETERNVIIEEYQTYMNNPIAKSFLEFRSILFKDHPYEVSPLGKIEDIRSVNRQSMTDYYRRWYRPDNAVIVVVGDIESSQSLVALVNRYFGGIGKSEDKEAEIALPAVSRRTDNIWMKRKVEFDVPLLLVGFSGPHSAHEDAVALDILQVILSQGETSRIHRSLVRKKGVAVMAGGMNHFMRLGGMTLFFAAFTPDTSYSAVEKALNVEIENIMETGFDKNEADKVRYSMLTSRYFELFSADQICQRLGAAEVIDGDWRLWGRRLEALESLEPKQIMEVGRKYWYPEARQTLMLVPKRFNLLLYVAGKFMKFFRKRGI